MTERLSKGLNCIDAEIRTDESLKRHCTFGIGGKAAIFVVPADSKSLVAAVNLCKETSAPYMVIGKGSNILFPDRDLDMVIISMTGINEIRTGPKSPPGEGHPIGGGVVSPQAAITAGAGALLKNIAVQAQTAGLAGFEFACGIPGTLGGALRMNAGAYGGDMSQVFKSAEILDKSGEIRTVYKEDMDFDYRHSAVEKLGLVVRAILELTPGDPEKIRELMAKNMASRNTKQPVDMPSAGSVFKRPGDGISAAKLIEECGLKGQTVGGAQVSEKHSGFIVNKGGATAADVRALIEHIRETVRAQKGITLEPEIIMMD